MRSVSASCSAIAASSAGLKSAICTRSNGGTPPYGPSHFASKGFSVSMAEARISSSRLQLIRACMSDRPIYRVCAGQDARIQKISELQKQTATDGLIAPGVRRLQLRAGRDARNMSSHQPRKRDRSLRRTIQRIDAKRSEEHTSELQSHSFISYAVLCLK